MGGIKKQLKKIRKELKNIREIIEEGQNREKEKIVNKVWKKLKKMYESDSDSDSESESSDSGSDSD